LYPDSLFVLRGHGRVKQDGQGAFCRPARYFGAATSVTGLISIRCA